MLPFIIEVFCVFRSGTEEMAIWAIIFVISYHTYHVKAQTSRPKFEI
jgi:hypothetical protein